MVQIEALLNSRPLIPLSNDPNDLVALTPAHLLIGDTLLSNAEPNLTHMKEQKLSRWQLLEKIRQHFWHNENLTSLQARRKWAKKTMKSFNIEDLVLIQDDNVLSLHWSMGRVKQIHPGTDGVVRAAAIKTVKRLFKRPTRKLYLVPTTK